MVRYIAAEIIVFTRSWVGQTQTNKILIKFSHLSIFYPKMSQNANIWYEICSYIQSIASGISRTEGSDDWYLLTVYRGKFYWEISRILLFLWYLNAIPDSDGFPRTLKKVKHAFNSSEEASQVIRRIARQTHPFEGKFLVRESYSLRLAERV